MNQSISEEWEKLFEGHCICDKYAPQEDIGCIIHGEDGIKAKKFIQSKISQAITAERKELLKRIREEVKFCPEAYGFEGRETFLDCGKCIVCEAKALLEEK